MYSQASWGGSVNPYITIKLDNNTQLGNKDSLVSVLAFEWKDQDLIGIERVQNDVKTVCMIFRRKKIADYINRRSFSVSKATSRLDFAIAHNWENFYSSQTLQSYQQIL
jgi:hypothetical protein